MNIAINSDAISIDNHPATAEEIDQLLCRLAMARSKMQPSIARTSMQQGKETIDLEFEPAIELTRTDDGCIYLAIRHSGFGWFRFVLSQRQALFLHTGLGKRLIPSDPIHDLDADEIDRNRPQ